MARYRIDIAVEVEIDTETLAVTFPSGFSDITMGEAFTPEGHYVEDVETHEMLRGLVEQIDWGKEVRSFR